jgi:histidinol-phosphate aminotransferase
VRTRLQRKPAGSQPARGRSRACGLPELHRYPDPLGGGLREAIARTHGLRREQVLLGDGSHELLMQLAQAFSGPGAGVLASQFGFAVYAIAAAAAGADFRAAPALPRMPPCRAGTTSMPSLPR